MAGFIKMVRLPRVTGQLIATAVMLSAVMCMR